MAVIKIDDELKLQADKLLKSLGLTPSEAVTFFLTDFVKTGHLPIELNFLNYEPNQETIDTFKETDRMIVEKRLANNETLDEYFERMGKEVAEFYRKNEIVILKKLNSCRYFYLI